MTEESNNESRSRFRSLISGGQQKSPAPEAEVSPLARLPKGRAKPAREESAAGDSSHVYRTSIPDIETPDLSEVPAASRFKPGIRFGRLKIGPPFWTIASILSLIVNMVLIVSLLLVVPNLRKMSMDLSKFAQIKPAEVTGGLYTNFEKMDRAHITTSIPVETSIPVKFDLKLNQQTQVVLSQDVVIENARVTVQTGGLNITKALATIILPQGTTLPVVLNLNVPVDTTVPVTLTVPVDIPLANTQLHEPFTGLQEVIKPLHCLVAPDAVNLSGTPICP